RSYSTAAPSLSIACSSDGTAVEYLRVDGGMVVNDSLCQFLADILDVCVERPKNVETTALGAAILAGVGIGLYPGLAEIGNAWQLDRKFEPKIGASSRAKLLQGYQHAVQQALS
ncbi:MAG: glycerol kinase, partial [Gammaproteobacteria bacterium]|nr:glycerol kinase [Gammaproteobacteria bacterium]